MDTQKTLRCPNCREIITNLQNCEDCGSLLVRFVDKGISINQRNYGKNATMVFPGMMKVLVAQHKRMTVAEDDIFCSIANAHRGNYILQTSSIYDLSSITSNVDYQQNGIAFFYTAGQNAEHDKKFFDIDFFPLFAFADKDADGLSHYWINFGQDYENAAAMLSRIIIEVYGVSSKTTLEYTIWTNRGIDIKNKGADAINRLGGASEEYIEYIYERYRGGIDDTLRKTYLNDSDLGEKIKDHKNKMIIYSILSLLCGVSTFVFATQNIDNGLAKDFFEAIFCSVPAALSFLGVVISLNRSSHYLVRFLSPKLYI